jgi:hypothetical protein
VTHRDQTIRELADYAKVVVRAGYLHRAQVLVEVGNFVRAEVPDEAEAGPLTDRLVAEAERALDADRATWSVRTDNDALADALKALAAAGFVVLEYCEDHFDASNALKARPESAGVVFFTETDVWHAVTEGMLEVKVWHVDSANVVPGDPELAAVLDALHRVGLPAIFDEGRIEVTMTWRRRPHPAEGQGSAVARVIGLDHAADRPREVI